LVTVPKLVKDEQEAISHAGESNLIAELGNQVAQIKSAG
jgi:hypothetical protein